LLSLVAVLVDLLTLLVAVLVAIAPLQGHLAVGHLPNQFWP
jgi:hypothetical protein